MHRRGRIYLHFRTHVSRVLPGPAAAAAAAAVRQSVRQCPQGCARESLLHCSAATRRTDSAGGCASIAGLQGKSARAHASHFITGADRRRRMRPHKPARAHAHARARPPTVRAKRELRTISRRERRPSVRRLAAWDPKRSAPMATAQKRAKDHLACVHRSYHAHTHTHTYTRALRHTLNLRCQIYLKKA